MLNHLNVGLNRVNSNDRSGAAEMGVDWDQRLGIKNASGPTFPQFLFDPKDTLNNYGQANFADDVINGLVVADSVSYQLGRHNLTMGLDWRAEQFSVIDHSHQSPSLSFLRDQTAAVPNNAGVTGNSHTVKAECLDSFFKLLHGQIGMKPCRGADHRQHQIELRRGQHHIERRFHRLVARAGDSQIDHVSARNLDAGPLPQLRERFRTGHRDTHAAAGKRIDHHGGAACSGGHDTDAARRSTRDGDARHQRKTFDQSVQGFHARDAAGFEKLVRNVVLAGERAGMRDRELARDIRAAELVCHDGLAARGSLLRESIKLIGLAHRFEKQHEAVDARIVNTAAQISPTERSTSLPTETGPRNNAACLCARSGAPISASAMRRDKNAPAECQSRRRPRLRKKNVGTQIHRPGLKTRRCGCLSA